MAGWYDLIGGLVGNRLLCVAVPDSRIVLAVVILLGATSLLLSAGLIWLVHDGTDPAAIALVSGPLGGALGALGALLATTRTVDPDKVAAEARATALADVSALDG